MPKGRLYPLTRDELVECAGLLRGIQNGRLDRLLPPVAPLDILAQQIVAACAAEDWSEDELFALMRRADHFRGLSREDIDEAFGRGSDESAQYGLKLFQQLNLQLLIVTPLQKIHIIEPFVAGVGFVHNEGGKTSVLRNLSIEEYRAEKQVRQPSN